MREGQFSPTVTAKVLDEVFREREKQDAKWGQQNHNAPEYLMILGEEVGEANKAALETYFKARKSMPPNVEAVKEDYSEYRKELIQIAAVAVAMIESLDRNGK